MWTAFQNRAARHDFHCQVWYQANSKYSGALLSDMDQANFALIRRIEGGER